MSEKNHSHIEDLESKSPEYQGTSERHEKEVNRVEAEAHQKEDLEAARREIAKESSITEKDKILEKLHEDEVEESREEAVKLPVNADLKKITFNKEIKHIRHKLSKSDQMVSKVIHQPVIRRVSEVSSKTITRPSGLLGGGIVAFLGTSTYLYLTKHIGIKYNYSMFLLLLVAGFVLGLFIEALFRLLRGRKTA